MEIKTLKDLKKALKAIPDRFLEDFGIGVDPEGDGVRLLCWDTEKDPVEKYAEVEEKYSEIKDISNWIIAIVNQTIAEQKSTGEELVEEPISSEDVNKPKCSKCGSSQVYMRLNTKERVCKTCGNVEKLK